MRTGWSASQYLQFEDQRNQPIGDLLHRICRLDAASAVDLGCGPGNSTIRVQQAFPNARVVGIDSSPDMIARARADHPDIPFLCQDIRALEGRYDPIFSNACLQWVPDHETLLPQLVEHLTDGGVLAAQFPMNQEEPLFQSISQMAEDPKWGFQHHHLAYNGTLAPRAYCNLLLPCCRDVQLWETKYYHRLPSHPALIEWVKGSRLRLYLSCLSPEQQAAFEEELLDRARQDYPLTAGGEVIFHFNRCFLVAVR